MTNLADQIEITGVTVQVDITSVTGKQISRIVKQI
jgi:hypothetical protein